MQDLGCRCRTGFRIQDVGQDSGCRIGDSGCRCRVEDADVGQDLGFGIWDLGCRCRILDADGGQDFGCRCRMWDGAFRVQIQGTGEGLQKQDLDCRCI